MAITINAPYATPAGVTATLSAGGTLAQNTTYYYMMFSRINTYPPGDPSATIAQLRYSALTAEGSFTTDSTNLTCTFTWTADGLAYHEVLLTKVSGSYDQCMAKGSSGSSIVVSSEPATRTANHYKAIGPNLPGMLSHDNGGIVVELSGACGAVTLTAIKAAVDAAGYSGYCYYDDTVFSLEGSIVVDVGTTGTLDLFNQHIFLIYGSFVNKASGFVPTLGHKSASGSYTWGDNSCVVTIVGRANIWDLSYGKYYGTLFKTSKITNAQIYSLFYYGAGFTDDNIHYSAQTSEAIEVTLDGGYLTGNYAASNVRTNAGFAFIASGSTPGTYNNMEIVKSNAYTLASGQIMRDSKIRYSGNSIYLYNNNATPNRLLIFQDCTMNPSNTRPLLWWGNFYAPNYWPDVEVDFSLNLKVVDASGAGISGATVTCTDVFGTQAFSVTTAASGSITQQYIKSVFAVAPTLAPSTFGATTNWTDYSPHTIVISKTGYATRTVIYTMDRKRDEIEKLSADSTNIY